MSYTANTLSTENVWVKGCSFGIYSLTPTSLKRRGAFNRKFFNHRVMPQDIRTIANQFIKTLEHRKSSDELLAFYHPDIKQIEFPNTVTKNRTVRNLTDLKEAAEKGRKVMLKEEYEVLNTWTFENTVIIEAIWTGTPPSLWAISRQADK